MPGPVQRPVAAKADPPVDGDSGRADGGGQMAWSRIVADQQGGPLQQPGQTPKTEPAGQIGRVAIEPVDQPAGQRLLGRRDHGQPYPLRASSLPTAASRSTDQRRRGSLAPGCKTTSGRSSPARTAAASARSASVTSSRGSRVTGAAPTTAATSRKRWISCWWPV